MIFFSMLLGVKGRRFTNMRLMIIADIETPF